MSDVSTLSLIQGGLVLGCSLVWAGVVKDGVKYIYPNDQGGEFRSQLIFAIILTGIVIIIINALKKTGEFGDAIKEKLTEPECTKKEKPEKPDQEPVRSDDDYKSPNSGVRFGSSQLEHLDVNYDTSGTAFGQNYGISTDRPWEFEDLGVLLYR